MTRSLRLSVPVLLIALAGAPCVVAQDLHLCTNQELAHNGTGRMSEELMGAVGRSLPTLRLQFSYVPWARCLKMAEQGEFDGVLVGSHSAERAKGLAYPLRPDGTLDASKRMFNLGFVLVRRTGTAINWDGERFNRQDGPIGVQRGYSVIEMLRDKQVPFDDGNPTVQGGLQKLMLGRVSGLLVNPFNLGSEDAGAQHAGKIEVAGPLIQSKPYFLIFSKAYFEARPELARRVWAAVEQARTAATFQRYYARQLDSLQEGVNLQP